MPPPRIAVVGTTGSGKTTVARRLARALAVPHVELDVLNYHPHGFALDVRDAPEFQEASGGCVGYGARLGG